MTPKKIKLNPKRFNDENIIPINCSESMIGENWQLVTDEPVEFEE